MKIGIFDSGLGGHFTLEKCQNLFPEHEFIGFFDHANAPYGDKSADEICRLTENGVQHLWSQNCNLVLIACNTACTKALRQLQEKYPHHKILGCLIPAIEIALDSGNKRIGLMATSRTIASKKYQREAFKINPHAKIFGLATPELVPWIEAGKENSSVCRNYLHKHIKALIDTHQIETLILGCTHYSALKSTIKKLFPNLIVVDSAETQALKLGNYLQRHPELKQ